MIEKLLLAHKDDMRSDLLEKLGITPFISGEHFEVAPAAWGIEHGPTHFAFLLKFRFKDFQSVTQTLAKNYPNWTLLNYDQKIKKPVENSLYQVGMKIYSDDV